MNTLKQAKPDHPVHELIANRWSPYGFADRPVSPEDLRSLFEAARWAPSSYNEQPWRYLVATKANPEQFARLLSCLVEANQAWRSAPRCWPWVARACGSRGTTSPTRRQSTTWVLPRPAFAWRPPLEGFLYTR